MAEREFWFPLHGDYGTVHDRDALAISARLALQAQTAAELRAEALERAIRANLGRADHVARIDGDYVTDLVRDADGETLAVVMQEWRGHVVSYSVWQLAEPSFIRY